MNFRAALVRVLEAIEDGDDVYAAELLRQALEEFDGEPLGPRDYCPVCGVGPMWPGQLDDHRRHVHEAEQAA